MPARQSQAGPVMGRGIFVGGTDTGIGKTVASAALIRALVASGRHAIGMKPVAAGIDAAGGVNADVEALAAAGNVDAPLRERNPYAFAAAVAPHVAAAAAGVAIELQTIAEAYLRLAARADVVIVEGAGGVMVPLSPRTDMLDIPLHLDIPVLLVVGLRLGCINHALMSIAAIRARGLDCVGWVANVIDPAMPFADRNIDALSERIIAPCVAVLPHHPSPVFPQAALARMGLASV